jgi:hypothetical protein
MLVYGMSHRVIEKQRACVFCGRTPATKEHIFPFWLREAVGGVGPAIHLRLEGRDHGPAPGDPLQYDYIRDAAEADVRVRVVCAPCNNEWMNDLDHDVEPLIVPLIRNHPVEVSEDDLVSLSRWATKIGLLLEHTRGRSSLTRRRSLTPPGAYARFAHTLIPPAEMRIWMLRISPPFTGAVWRTALIPVAAYDPDAARALGAPNGSLTTFAIGMLGFQLMFAPLTRPYEELAEKRTHWGEQFMRVLWPPTAPLDWPPPAALRQEKFDMITH